MRIRSLGLKTLSFAATDTTKSFTANFPTIAGNSRFGARAFYGIMVVPDWAAAGPPTLQLDITDADSLTLYTKTGLAEATTYYLRKEDTSSWGGNIRTFDVPLIDLVTFTFTTSVAVGAGGGDIKFKLYYSEQLY